MDDVISVDSIMNLKFLPMAIFEQKLWGYVKNRGCIPESDRRRVKIIIWSFVLFRRLKSCDRTELLLLICVMRIIQP